MREFYDLFAPSVPTWAVLLLPPRILGILPKVEMVPVVAIATYRPSHGDPTYMWPVNLWLTWDGSFEIPDNHEHFIAYTHHADWRNDLDLAASIEGRRGAYMNLSDSNTRRSGRD